MHPDKYLSNAERHRRTLTPVRVAIRNVKDAIKVQDGLEFTGVLKETLEDLERIAERLPVYAAQAKGGVR